MMAEIWGITPEARVFCLNIFPNPARASVASWIRAPPESSMPTMGAPVFKAMAWTLAILLACISPRDPPSTVKSWA